MNDEAGAGPTGGRRGGPTTGADPAAGPTTGADPAAGPTTGADPTGVGPTAGDGPHLLAAEALASELWERASAHRGLFERARAARVGRMLASPGGLDLVLALTDEVLRIRPPARAAAVLAGLVGDRPKAAALGRVDAAALRAGGRLGPRLPRLVVPAARQRVRAEMAGVILPAAPWRLARHAEHRRRQGIRLNVNVLGEAILGEDEAEQRLQRVLDVLAQPAVDYVSVKISSICSQLDVLRFEREVERIAARLRRLYDAANALPPAQVRQPRHGGVPGPGADAGGVPTGARRATPTPAPQRESCCRPTCPTRCRPWRSCATGLGGVAIAAGAWVKVRLVKGANLAMERVDAELHGWPAAPFPTKEETDANYKRMLDVLLDPANDGAVRRRRRQPQRVRGGMGRHRGRGPEESATGSRSRCSRAWPRRWPR